MDAEIKDLLEQLEKAHDTGKITSEIYDQCMIIFSLLVMIKAQIQKSAAESAQLREQLAAVTAERDAAVEEMNHVCDTCGHDILIAHCHNQVHGECVNWKWRGPQGAGEADRAD